ncbi:hypothetical protein HNQ60_002471 [Povalibacter uvarum]|uniref:PepSY domain-containing protein n=1 Tax=Povalibacter uvarum TaxID=732238 RepID=A0A841HMT9_9GAMM|nr:PepSY domain-containing protein [Povalibacter uvarum]MBB6093590.1 hypothetical protein [Povalibacter uvarum]
MNRFKVPVLAAILAVLSGAAVLAAETTPNLLSLGDLEQRMTAQGITIKEIELKQLVAEIEGKDAQGRKVELVVDRRSGEVLARKPD